MKKELIEKTVRITLAGVPNVGKSTVFNSLTGMKQHTGNWTGKTVECAEGSFIFKGVEFTACDIPGTYSLYPHSDEERKARDFIINNKNDLTVIVCDGACPERSLTLALQILEVTRYAVIFFNLADEGKKNGVVVDTEKMNQLLGVPVIYGTAKKKKDISALKELIFQVACGERSIPVEKVFVTPYPFEIESVLTKLEDTGMQERYSVAAEIYENPTEYGLDAEKTRDSMATAFVMACDGICSAAVRRQSRNRIKRDIILDQVFAGRFTAFPVMSLLIVFIFWLTVRGANYPSDMLWNLFVLLGDRLKDVLLFLGCPDVLCSFLTDGVYRVSTWIVSVMLPPMAIFFPMFTFLEDLGYLPRVAFCLDRCFKKCGGCGKQALCMCMGLGCNAVGVTGCRIIDSKRERLIAILTNSMIPCNGRFPAILTLAAIFFASGGVSGSTGGITSAVFLFFVLVFSVSVTLFASRFLSLTFLKGTPSSFSLELPPFRLPRVGETLVRSVLDRTVFVLGRAVTAAIPAGALIWILANVNAGGASLLHHISTFFDPLGKLMGFDGMMLCAFILGFPANETVLPIAIMGYLSGGVLPEADSLDFVSRVLAENGWTMTTALCTIVFSLFHWPCATTLMTVKKETGSTFWTFFSAVYPTLFGIILCILINYISKGIGFLF